MTDNDRRDQIHAIVAWLESLLDENYYDDMSELIQDLVIALKELE